MVPDGGYLGYLEGRWRVWVLELADMPLTLLQGYTHSIVQNLVAGPLLQIPLSRAGAGNKTKSSRVGLRGVPQLTLGYKYLFARGSSKVRFKPNLWVAPVYMYQGTPFALGLHSGYMVPKSRYLGHIEGRWRV